MILAQRKNILKLSQETRIECIKYQRKNSKKQNNPVFISGDDIKQSEQQEDSLRKVISRRGHLTKGGSREAEGGPLRTTTSEGPRTR